MSASYMAVDPLMLSHPPQTGRQQRAKTFRRASGAGSLGFRQVCLAQCGWEVDGLLQISLSVASSGAAHQV